MPLHLPPHRRSSGFRGAVLTLLVLASLMAAGGTASAAHAQDDARPTEAGAAAPRWVHDALRLGTVRDAQDLRAVVEDLRERRQEVRDQRTELARECGPSDASNETCAQRRERLDTEQRLLDLRERNLRLVFGDLDRAAVALAVEEGREEVTGDVGESVDRLSDARSARLDADRRIVQFDAQCGAEAARIHAQMQESTDALERERLRAQLAEHRDACQRAREPMIDERRALLREERASERGLSHVARSGQLDPMGDALARVA